MKFLQRVPRKYLIPGTIVVLVLIIWAFSSHSAAPLATAKVVRGTVARNVSVTGNTEAAQDLNLAFEVSGRIVRIPVSTGDTVYAGKPLVMLDSSVLQAQLEQARATLAMQQAKLDSLKKGSRPEDIAAKQAQTDSAVQALDDAERTAQNSILTAYTSANDALRNVVAPLFSSKTLTYSTGNPQARADVQSNYDTVDANLVKWQSEIGSLVANSDAASTESALESSLVHLQKLQFFMSRISDTLDPGAAASLSGATYGSYKTIASQALSTVNASIATLSSQDQAVAAADSAAKVARATLSLAQAGNTDEDIRAQEAAVLQAKGGVDSAAAQIAKTAIVSPIDGTVTNIAMKEGELVTPGTPIVTLMSSENLELEADIPEVDILAVKVGDSATVKLDAFGTRQQFDARVISIDPASTPVQGVATYKTKFQFTKKYDGVKPGMTADISVVGEKHENALLIPQKAVQTKGLDKIVTVKTDKGQEQRTVTIGLRDDKGNVEVVNGLNEGDTIMVSAQ